jgi:hypothetical protein
VISVADRADRVIRFLKEQLTKRSKRATKAPVIFPVASPKAVGDAERQLGFKLPPLLKRVYLEVGNGGRGLGPGFGLLGLPGGYDNDDGWDVVKTSREMAADVDWWDRMIVVCDWGCAMRSCVDCGDSDFPVYRWDGNQFDERTDHEDPSEKLWQIETDTLSEWLLTPNCA